MNCVIKLTSLVFAILVLTMSSAFAADGKSFTGKWKRTNVGREYGAEINITPKTGDSFYFEFQGAARQNVGEIDGTAKLTSPTKAVFFTTEDDTCKGVVYFELKENLHVTFERNECLGLGNNVFIDGEYTKGKPKYKK